MVKPVVMDQIEPESGSNYPEPFGSRMGQSNWRPLGDHFGLTQFGFNYETYQPGAQSSVRHWHTLQDEIVYVLEGELTLVDDEGESLMSAGMCAGFKAGDRNAHHLVNNSDAVAVALVVGTRPEGDLAYYPHDDLAWMPGPEGFAAVHKDGTPYSSE